jgi:EAL domain-containing protein (putative c-di-GMP-specific phosphodiesterase class I)
MFYQPIIHLATGTLAGFEALIRWEHPTRGMIPPNEFIPIAEENGMILRLGQWAVLESCTQLRKWQEANRHAGSLKVSVNLSSKEFRQPDLAKHISQILRSTGLEPECLKLEITESQVMENTDLAVAIINRLRNLGIELSLDDFGTGYSSLSYLHRLPFAYLKIDRSFVGLMTDNIENYEIVHTIIKLAQSLKMRVIAEGIETPEQAESLRLLNCDFGQGYFYLRPIDAKAAAEFIRDSFTGAPVGEAATRDIVPFDAPRELSPRGI